MDFEHDSGMVDERAGYGGIQDGKHAWVELLGGWLRVVVVRMAICTLSRAGFACESREIPQSRKKCKVL